MKIILCLIIIVEAGIIGRYWWLDTDGNYGTITDQIQSDFIHYCEKGKDLL